MLARLNGIFVPHMVPLDERGEINEAELRRYIDWLIERGVHGLYPNGSSGEFLRFSVEERRRIIQIVCDQTRGRVPILAGAAEANAKATIEACEVYKDYGATAVAIVSPYYYKLSAESVYAYFREIALNSPVDVTLYNIPMFASPIDVTTIRRLAELDRITGIKDSSGDMAHMLRMIAAVRPLRDDFTFLCGWEAALAPMLLMGCDGGTNSMAGVLPEMLVDLYKHSVNQRIEQAKELQLRFLEFFDTVVYSADFPEGLRAAVELRGFNMGRSRQPLSDKQKIDRAALQRVIQCIIADYGYGETPPDGCPPRAGATHTAGENEAQRISQVTAEVTHKLRQRGLL